MNGRLASALAAGLIACLGVAVQATAKDVRLSYVAHACFVVESPGGVRVLIDPYNGARWLGYRFPGPISADVVLVSHPHYDHDASYSATPEAPVLRLAGDYRFGDVSVRGVPGKHADPYGREFGQINTIWVVETGGLRIVHLGDSGPLDRVTLSALGRVDVLLTPADDQQHILKHTEIAAIRRALQPRVTIPMHYRLTALSDLPKSLGPIDGWLAEQANVDRLTGHELRLSPEALPAAPTVLVPRPSPDVRPWRESLRLAWRHHERARDLDREPGGTLRALDERRRAHALGGSIVFAHDLGKALVDAGRPAEAVSILETALLFSGADDWDYTALCRDLLASRYTANDQAARAAEQYRLVLRTSHSSELLKRARAYLDGRPDSDR